MGTHYWHRWLRRGQAKGYPVVDTGRHWLRRKSLHDQSRNIKPGLAA